MSPLDPYKDAAQAMVTAILAGDRDTPVTIVREVDNPQALALVMADLCAYVHRRWSDSVGMDEGKRAEGWQMLMIDIEAWRARPAST